MTLTYLTRARLSPGFDLVENLDSRDCLRKNASISARRRFTQMSRGVRVARDGVVCMMRAFGNGGRLGPICPTGVLPLLEVIATTGYDLAVVEGETFNVQQSLRTDRSAVPSRLKRRVWRFGDLVVKGSCGSQNLRNFPSVSPGGRGGLETVVLVVSSESVCVLALAREFSLSQQILVCAETPAKSYSGVRGNAHPVCLFNARVASSWKLRNLAFFWRITRRKLSGLCQGSKVRRLAKKEHSAALAQLVSRTSAIMKFGAGAGV